MSCQLTCQSLVDVLSYQAENYPSKTAYIFLNEASFAEEKLTYAELDIKAKALAVAIQEQGLKKGDRALLIFAPGLDLICAYFGCLYAGVIAIPVYPPLNAHLLEKTQLLMKNSKPRLLLATQDSIMHLGKPDGNTDCERWAFEKLPCLATDHITPIFVFAERWHKPDIQPQDIAFLQYTSGSTMDPKGVIISHGNLLHNIALINQGFRTNSQSIALAWLPPYHDMGLIGHILAPLYSGVTSILMAPFSFLKNPLGWLKNIHKYKATITGGPNFTYDYCVRRIGEEKKAGLDLSSWQIAYNGAEPIRADTMERFYHAFKDYGFRKEAFNPCYGLAEATLFVTGKVDVESYQTVTLVKEHLQNHKIQIVADSQTETIKLVSSGKMLQTVKIVDPEKLSECEKDTVGEIWVDGASVAQGYWRQEDETAHAFHGKIKDDDTNTSYLRSGDLGFLHNEELYVTGRIKDLIILYGKNHYPQDIEHTVSHCHPQICAGNLAAFTTEVNDEFKLSLVCEVQDQNMETTEQEHLFKTINTAIYQNHQLEVHNIVLIPPKAIPKTTSGKIRRNFCRQSLSQKTLPVIASWQAR